MRRPPLSPSCQTPLLAVIYAQGGSLFYEARSEQKSLEGVQMRPRGVGRSRARHSLAASSLWFLAVSHLREEPLSCQMHSSQQGDNALAPVKITPLCLFWWLGRSRGFTQRAGRYRWPWGIRVEGNLDLEGNPPPPSRGKSLSELWSVGIVKVSLRAFIQNIIVYECWYGNRFTAGSLHVDLISDPRVVLPFLEALWIRPQVCLHAAEEFWDWSNNGSLLPSVICEVALNYISASKWIAGK